MGVCSQSDEDSSSGSSNDSSGSEKIVEPVKTAAVISVSFAGIVGILLGFDIGIVAGILLPITKYFHLNHYQTGLFVGIFSTVALPGSVLAGPLANSIGRRWTLVGAGLLFMFGNALLACAWSFEILLMGRIVAGFAMGATLTVAPLYIAEISPARLRGTLTTAMEVSYNVGIVLGYFTSWALHFTNMPENRSWRVMMGLGCIPPLIIIFGALCCMYESPRWLAAVGRLPEAEEACWNLLGPVEAKSTIERLGATTLEMPKQKELRSYMQTAIMSWVQLLTLPSVRFVTFLGVSVSFFCQAQGIETVLYYSNDILQEAGIKKSQMLFATMLLGCAKTVTIFVSGYFVDRCGRRPLLILSSSGMGACMGTLAIAALVKLSGGLHVAAMFLYMVFFSLGYGPIVYIFNGEIFPQDFRSQGMSFAMGVNRITSAMVATFFPAMKVWMTEAGALGVYAGISLAATLFVAALVPETRGTVLEDANMLQF